MKYSWSASRVITALAVGIFAIPLTTTALIRSQDDSGFFSESVQNLHQSALRDRVARRARARRYWRAMEVYRDFTRNGELNLVRPDLNDTSTVDPYLASDAIRIETVTRDKEADYSADIIERYNQLIEAQRDLLDGYAVMGYCPQSLQRLFRNSFYEFCTEYVSVTNAQRIRRLADRRPARLRGFFQPGRTAPHQTLRERLRILGNKLDRRTIAAPYRRRDRSLTKPVDLEDVGDPVRTK